MAETQSSPPDGERPPGDDATAAGDAPADHIDLDRRAPPSDDSPTIISKAATPRPGDDAAGAALRGRRLAHFELIEPIGVGGMAAVLRARDTQLDRFVALKILPPDMAADPENVSRFHQEARSAAKLDHENVARVFYCGEDQRLHFIAFEFVEGDNLRTILERRGRLPVAEALHYVLQVAAGLAHAAQRGVVHRDIKPSNIIITPTGRAKLVDMGLARSLEPQDKGLTASGVTLGTFDYISPEQALEPRDADVRSDIYSLGCTFYHLLTGRPPVPEGTAAKKLQHHQHVKPRDPRELVPGLPDEVAVILDRMMAKQPKDRYQSPEQLVHHLLLAGRKLGAVANVPEGVLSVEAALPQPPGGRPLLFAALAAGLVVLLIVLLEVFNRTPPAPAPSPPAVQATPNPPKNDAGAPPGAAVQVKDKQPPEKEPIPPPTPAVADRAVYNDETPTQGELREWLKANPNAATIEIVLAHDLDLALPPPGEGDVGLSVAAPHVIVRAKPGTRPTIRFRHDSRPQDPRGAWTALAVEGKTVEVRGVRFVVDGQDADVQVAGLSLHGRPRDRGEECDFVVEGCEFLQTRSLHGERRLASLVADAGAGGRATLKLTDCCFLGFQDLQGAAPDLVLHGAQRGGDDAVVRRGAVEVRAADCAFGPHATAFRLEGKGTRAVALAAEHCSVIAGDHAAVFAFAAGAGGRLDLRGCLFARPAAPEEGAGAVLLRDADPDDVTCIDRDNRYYGLDAYWPAAGDKGDWAAFQRRVVADRSGDSFVLDAPPWDHNPLEALKDYELARGATALGVAFQNNERLLELRTAADRGQPVGVRRLGDVNYADRLAVFDKQDSLLKKIRIVDSSVKDEDRERRVYPTLEEAVAAAQPGDVVLIREKGVVKVDAMLLNKKEPIDLTIKPYPGRHPVLTLSTRKYASALFKVLDGQLRLEGLEFLLQPDQPEFRSQALVALPGSGQCTLRRCVVTLDPNKQPAALALATLSDAGELMMPAPGAAAPQLELENCLVRGEGDLVAGPGGRPFELTATNTAVVLKGSVVSLEAPADAKEAPPGQVGVTLRQVTALLNGNLVRLHGGKDMKGLLPVKCAPNHCLFVTPKAVPQPLFHFDGLPDLDETAVHAKVSWDGDGNGYVNYTTMLDQAQTDDSMMMTPPVNTENWDKFWGGKNTGKVLRSFRFAGDWAGAWPDGPLTRVTPAQLRPAEAAGCGADVGPLPRPLAGDGK
jgi:serine/threonine protein kinase